MNTEPSSTYAVPAVPWGIRELIYAALFALVGIIALNVGVLIFSFITGAPLRLAGETLIVFLLAQSAIFIGAAWWFGLARYRVGWSALGWRRFDAPIGCATSAGALIVSYAINFCYAIFVVSLGIRFSTQDIMSRLDLAGPGVVAAFLIVAALVPVVEETFFRGFVYSGLRGRFGARSALILSTLIFALLHFSLDRLIPILVLGGVLAWLYERTGSLVPGVILHGTNNAFALAAYLLAKAMGLPLP
ncbi:MAG: CPBP family intramembrane metalloprotease [Chloroflexi bacterium]|nr:CPBP family intramembrane metalloprotease [Chloroflexota bacterium]